VAEPSALTEQAEHVNEYGRAIETVMILPYLLMLDIVKRASSPKGHIKEAIDLCCGPGHFTRLLAQHLNYQNVTGVDLSDPMLEIAAKKSAEMRLSDKTNYLKSDVANLRSVADKSKDLVSFMDGAHHMITLNQVRDILKEAERVVKSDGLIVVLDPVRPKTKKVAEMYLEIAGQPYVDLGLHHFNKDFRDSVYASWTPEELHETIPQDTKRKWVQLIPFGFPAFQIIVGLPEGRSELFVNEDGLSKELLKKLVPVEGKADWNLLKLSFQLATKK
jgi:ubiquinone/menaquinone biosynthesis C-methylase UbiE